MPGVLEEMKPPVLIVGNPRSGTTLLRLMINNHGNIVVPPECGFAMWWHAKYRDWCMESTLDRQLLDQFIQDLSTSRKIETWNLDFLALREFVRSALPSSYAELVSCVYVFFGNSLGKVFHRWGDKNNFHTRCIDSLHALFPHARFIHIVRDGRDVACSYRDVASMRLTSKYAPSLPTDIVDIATDWADNVGNVLASFAAIGWDLVHEVRYEDLVADADSELERVCEFLAEPYDARMLHYHVNNREEQQEPAEFLPWKTMTLKKPTTSQIGKFHHQLAREEIQLFQKHARHLLDRYQYEIVP